MFVFEFNIRWASAISKKGDAFLGLNHGRIHRQVIRVSAAIVYKAKQLFLQQCKEQAFSPTSRSPGKGLNSKRLSETESWRV